MATRGHSSTAFPVSGFVWQPGQVQSSAWYGRPAFQCFGVWELESFQRSKLAQTWEGPAALLSRALYQLHEGVCVWSDGHTPPGLPCMASPQTSDSAIPRAS